MTTFTIDAVATQVADAAERIADFCAGAGLNDTKCFHVQVSVAEALNNIIEHAFSGEDSLNRIRISCEQTREAVVVSATDNGATLDYEPGFLFPDSEEESGRGWPIIFNWMDSVEYCVENDRNVLVMKMDLRHTYTND